MSSPTAAQERRESPRARIEPLAYISLEPDNGGIVLNISEGGLCFHCTAPVHKTGTIHFWFSRQHHRIEGEAELAWMDPSQKRGGLRFTNLPADSRDLLRDWLEPVPLPVFNDERSLQPAVGISSSPFKLRAAAVAQPLSPRDTISRARQGRTGFAKGLITGLFISAVFAGGFFIYSYRRHIGESLIRIGERLAPQSHPLPTSTSPPATVSSSNLTATAAPTSTARPPAPAPPSLSAQAPTTKPEASEPVPLKVATARSVGTLATAAPTPPPVSLPSNSPAAKLSIFSGVHGGATKVEITPTAPSDAGSNQPAASKMFFDVGKFKHEPRAQSAAEELSKLGFPAAVVQKKSLWTDSYQVMVGPYGYDEKAEAAHQQLLSHGFPARAIERGSHGLVLRPGLSLRHTAMPAGNYDIAWESYVTHAKVRFLQHDSVIATAEARWVKSAVTYDNNAIVYKLNDDGSKTLLQILFAGMDRALVFE